MSFLCAPYSIITRALKHIVSPLGSICLIADDGNPFTNEKISGLILCDVSGMEAKTMKHSCDSTPVTKNAMELASVIEQKANSNAGNGQAPLACLLISASPSKGGAQ